MPSTSSRSPTSRKLSTTPSRSSTTCRKKRAKLAFPRPSANSKNLSTNSKRRSQFSGAFSYPNSQLHFFFFQLLSQPPYLLHMMPSMNQMKLPPLIHREWPEKRMIQHLRPRSKLCCAPVHDLIHGADRRNDLSLHLFRRNSPRARVRRRLSSFWQIPEPNHHHRLNTIFPASLRRQRPLSCEHASEAFRRPCVCQIQMLQDFRRAPFLRLLPAQLLWGQSRHRRLDLLPQFL